MNISPINLQQPKTSFKSTFPIVHWVAETNGSYAPVANLEIVRLLQSKLIRMLNKPLNKSKKPMDPLEQRLRAYLGRCDLSYRQEAVARSFYNTTEAYPNRFSPISYIITGKDVDRFNQEYAMGIGRAKGSSSESEINSSLKHYHKGGLGFVKNEQKQIRDTMGIAYVLHTKFEIIRNKLGKIKGYKFVEARFLPSKPEENRLGVM